MQKKNSTHITLLCSRLDLPGGIERAVVNTANLLLSHGHTITIIILDETNSSFYPIHPAVSKIQLPLSFGITPSGNIISRKIKLLTDVLRLRKLLKSLQTDCVIATEYPFAAAAILAGIQKYATVYSWEHHHYYELKRNAFWDKVFRLTYPRLSGIICLNEDERKLFAANNANSFVIPNFIQTGEKNNIKKQQLLTIARLTEVKGIDWLLQTAALVLDKHPGWTWKLIGNGELHTDVSNFITTNHLQGKLILQTPTTHDVIGEYLSSSIYIMTSRNECFPMTLLEAQSAALPCIAFDCDTGPRHIITHQENGLLVEKGNCEKLAAAINLLIEDEEGRKKMGENAIAAMQRFSPEKIYQLWKELVITTS